MATETIKLITGIGELLSGTLLVFNALTLSFTTFSFAADPANKAIRSLQQTASFCSDLVELPELDATALVDWLTRPDAPLLIDVREPAEYEQDNLGGTLIPLATLLQTPERIPANQPVVVHCQSGVRSRRAVEFLCQQGYTQVMNLQGGLSAVRRSGKR